MADKRDYKFQFPLHRDPRCNHRPLLRIQHPRRVSVPFTSGSSLQQGSMYQLSISKPCSFSSLYIGILAATSKYLNQVTRKETFQFPLHRDPRCNVGRIIHRPHIHCFSSLYIGILAATEYQADALRKVLSFSSLYIGILAATRPTSAIRSRQQTVSVPFTSGSSLQLIVLALDRHPVARFSSLYIGILAATTSSPS